MSSANLPRPILLNEVLVRIFTYLRWGTEKEQSFTSQRQTLVKDIARTGRDAGGRLCVIIGPELDTRSILPGLLILVMNWFMLRGELNLKLSRHLPLVRCWKRCLMIGMHD